MAFVHQQSQGAGVGSSHRPSCSWLSLFPLDHFTQPGEMIQVKKNRNFGSVALFTGLDHPRDVVHGPACRWFLIQQGSVGTSHLTSHPTQLLLILSGMVLLHCPVGSAGAGLILANTQLLGFEHWGRAGDVVTAAGTSPAYVPTRSLTSRHFSHQVFQNSHIFLPAALRSVLPHYFFYFLLKVYVFHLS